MSATLRVQIARMPLTDGWDVRVIAGDKVYYHHIPRHMAETVPGELIAGELIEKLMRPALVETLKQAGIEP